MLDLLIGLNKKSLIPFEPWFSGHTYSPLPPLLVDKPIANGRRRGEYESNENWKCSQCKVTHTPGIRPMKIYINLQLI